MSDRDATKTSEGPFPADAVIRCEGLAKTYAEGTLRTQVFEGLDLLVDPGETVAIVGVSGSGKSTLLHLLGGLDMPTAGEVYVAGQKMSALSDADRGRLRNRALGFVYQFHHLLPEFTALENVMLPVLLNGAPVAEASNRARALLESVELGHRLEHKPGELSGGERQRAAVARALVNRPARRRAHRQSRRKDRRDRFRPDAGPESRPRHQPGAGHPRSRAGAQARPCSGAPRRTLAPVVMGPRSQSRGPTRANGSRRRA
jgi:lipoprotein-releasing system ATP-binding protein